MTTKKIKPIHPGEILLEEFIKPTGLSQNQLADDILAKRLDKEVRIYELVHENT